MSRSIRRKAADETLPVFRSETNSNPCGVELDEKQSRPYNMPESEPKTAKLTDKQERFCQYYVLNGGNGAKAVRDAGYECEDVGGSAYIIAHENIRKPNVIARIEEIRKETGDTFAVRAEEVLHGLRTVAQRCMQDEPVTRGGEETGEYVFDSGGAIRAFELLGKTRGMFIDRQEVSMNIEDLAERLNAQDKAMDEFE